MKNLTLTTICTLLAIAVLAQAPQGISHQAVIRDASNQLVTESPIGIQVSIIQGTPEGTIVYSETHLPTSNANGLISFVIGQGTLISGMFAEIDWTDGPYFIETKADPTGGTNYTIEGASQILSVPYALHAKHATSLTLTANNGLKFQISIDQNGNLTTYFVTGPCPGTPFVTDIEGNIYNTVLIGDQCWMKENLKTNTYNNGTPIPTVTDPDEWGNLSSGAYVWYENVISWNDKYGALYNWFATFDSNGLCPTGWHVPTHDEWTALTDYIGGTSPPHGNELKSCRQINSPPGGGCNTSEHPRWDEHETHYGTDVYGFSGLPGGLRFHDGNFHHIGYYGTWWASTEYLPNPDHAWIRSLTCNDGDVVVLYSLKQRGRSVRCLRD